MKTIYVVNVKCNGCANTIKKELEKHGIKNITIYFTDQDSVYKRKITFEGNYNLVKDILDKLGYPEYGSEKANSLIKKGISYISCVIGKIY